jgi:hypothetical protein
VSEISAMIVLGATAWKVTAVGRGEGEMFKPGSNGLVGIGCGIGVGSNALVGIGCRIVVSCIICALRIGDIKSERFSSVNGGYGSGGRGGWGLGTGPAGIGVVHDGPVGVYGGHIRKYK